MTGVESGPIRATDGEAAVRECFARLGACCAARDYAAAEALFAPDVASFGTRAAVVRGRDHLRTRQWEGIWGSIEGFAILVEHLHVQASGDLAWGMAPWTSTGFAEDGTPFERPGRATLVLERRAGVWQAVHSHFSLAPGTPSKTFPRTPG